MQTKFKIGSVGLLLIFLVAALVVLGSIIFYKGNAGQTAAGSPQNAAAGSASAVSKSDAVTAIDADLSGTDFSQIDNELSSFDSAFK